MTDLDQQIDAAHADVERLESEAKQIEARMLKAGITPPVRPYGRPVDVRQNLTVRTLLQQRDPALASFLGVASDLAHREAEAKAIRELDAERLRLLTEQTRQANAAAADQRYRRQLNPLPTGWRARC